MSESAETIKNADDVVGDKKSEEKLEKPDADKSDLSSGGEAKSANNSAVIKSDKSDSKAKNGDSKEETNDKEKPAKEEESDVSDSEKNAGNGQKGKKNDAAAGVKAPAAKVGKNNATNKKSSKKDDEENEEEEEKAKSGKSLSEIAKIDKYITSTRVDHLQTLHTICFDAAGKVNVLKKNLRQFAGFEFEKDSNEYKKKLEAAQKNDIAKLKAVCEGLQLDKKGSKEILSQRICEFLLAPDGSEDLEDDVEEEEEEEDESEEESEPEEVAPKKRRGAPPTNKRNAREEKVSKTGRPRRATAGRGRDSSAYVDYSSSDEGETFTRTKKRRRDDSDSGSDYNPSGGSGDSDGGKKGTRFSSRGRPASRRSARRRKSSESEEEETPSSDDLSDEPKKKAPSRRGGRGRPARGKKAAETESEEESEVESEKSDVPKRKAPAAKNNANSKNAKAKPAERPKRSAAPSKSAREESDGEEDNKDDAESEDDEPLSKKAKTAPPSDEDIKKYVKEILDKANLEEITMKTVCKQVYAKYPDFDLSHKKDFIKTTVKSLIST